jgi:hypothetical protein
MIRFKQIIQEALTPMAGQDSGWKDVIKFQHNGEEHHAVVNYAHLGGGHYKVVARVGKPGKVGFRPIATSTPIMGAKVASLVQKSVEGFMKDKEWNAISMGGTNSRNKAHYQRYAMNLNDANPGKYKIRLGSTNNPIGGAVTIHKVQKVAAPVTSGKAVPDEHSSYDIGNRGGGSSSSSGVVDDFIKYHPVHGKYGVSGKLGPYKKHDTMASKSGSFEASDSAAGSEGSSSSSEHSGASSESKAASAK